MRIALHKCRNAIVFILLSPHYMITCLLLNSISSPMLMIILLDFMWPWEVVVTHPFISVYSCATINVWPYSSLLWWHVSKRALLLLKGSCKRTFALNGYRLWNFNCLIVHGENRLLSCEWMTNKAKTVPWGISLPIRACFIPQRQASLSPASCPLESWTQTQIKVWSLLSESKCHMAVIKSYQNSN